MPSEIYQYVEAAKAYSEFIRSDADDLEAALQEVSDPEIADRVRHYGPTHLVDGREIDIRGCLASFYPPGMEALVCGARPERYEELPKLGATRDRLALVQQIVSSFPIAARTLIERNRGRASFEIATEYDVQDLLFCLLRAVFTDVRREEWTPQSAGSAKRIDIVVPSLGALIEAKFVRDAAHARRVADELRVDFECYHLHSSCKHVVPLVVDPKRLLIDPVQFADDLGGLRRKRASSFDVTVLVR